MLLEHGPKTGLLEMVVRRQCYRQSASAHHREVPSSFRFSQSIVLVLGSQVGRQIG